jgi:hypothetical protein
MYAGKETDPKPKTPVAVATVSMVKVKEVE